METVTIPVTVINKVLDYLASRPFREVYLLIAELKAAGDAASKTGEGHDG